MYKFVSTKSHTVSNFSKIFFQQLYTGWIVVVHLCFGFSLWRQNLREILRMVISDTVINTLFRGLTLDPAGMHCPSWDDAFVSSYNNVPTMHRIQCGEMAVN